MELLLWALKNWKILAVIAIMTALLASGYTLGARHVQSQWDSEKLKTQEELAKKTSAAAKTILDLETTKNENLTRIDGLLANNHALWLRLPKKPCDKPTGPADTGLGQQPSTGGGSLYSVAPDPLEEYSRKVGELFGQCDKIVESCRVNAEYLKSLKPR